VRDPDLVALVAILGTLHARHEEYGEAERCYRHAIRVLDPQSPTLYREYTAVLMSNLADLYGSIGRSDDALASAKRALAVLDSLPSALPGAKLAVLNNTGSVLLLTGSPEKAEPLFRRAVSVGENAFGPESTMLVNVFANYRECLRQLKRPSEARNIEKRARTIMAKYHRENGMRQTVDVHALAQQSRLRSHH
jgi:tetratricopeptide (TPR) repeat protein